MPNQSNPANSPSSPSAPMHWGAVRDDDGRWQIGFWAPAAKTVDLCIGDKTQRMVSDETGFWRAWIDANPGTPYGFCIDGQRIHDPAARQQESSLSGPSLLHDEGAYDWQTDWHGRPWRDLVIMELHIGTFTPEGTFRAAAERLGELAGLGITAVQLMPVAHGPGRYGWGYDGVLPFAPHPAYGTPDDLRALIDHAHGLGLCVMLDVVFNHFGPQGCAMLEHVADFTGSRETPWGSGFSFTKSAVRAFFIECALMWLRDYRLDGLRFDAVHQMHDDSETHILAAMAQAICDAGLNRPIHLVTEDERNDPTLGELELMHGQWNDDYHHAVHVLLTGEDESYYAPFAVDALGDLARSLTEGFVGQGQDGRHGKPSEHLPWDFFVNSNQTHDQIGNRAFGDRLITLAPEDGVKVAHALLLVSPFTPMLFMGEERGETAPFRYFADYSGKLGQLVRDGRRREMAAFSTFAAEDVPDPTDRAEVTVSRLGWAVDARAQGWLDLTRKLLYLRRDVLLPLYRSGRLMPAVAERTGPRSLRIVWPCQQGSVELWIALGVPHEIALPASETAKLTLGDPVNDPFSLMLVLPNAS